MGWNGTRFHCLDCSKLYWIKWKEMLNISLWNELIFNHKKYQNNGCEFYFILLSIVFLILLLWLSKKLFQFYASSEKISGCCW